MDGKNDELAKLKARMASMADAKDKEGILGSRDVPTVVTEAPGTTTPASMSSEKQQTINGSVGDFDSKLNIQVADVKEGDVSSVNSRKFVKPGANRNRMIKKQMEDFANLKGNSNENLPPSDNIDSQTPLTDSEQDNQKKFPQSTLSESVKEAAIKRMEKKGATPEQVAEYEQVYEKWKSSRDRAHKLEEEYNQKYQQHIESQSMLWRGVRQSFGLQPKLNTELEALQGASIVARRDYREAARELLLSKKEVLGPRTKTTPITQTPKEYGGAEAVGKRYESMLAHHIVTNVYKKRLEVQKQAIDKVWSGNPVGKTLDLLRKHKYKTLTGVAVGATILSGGAVGAVAAGMIAGLGVGIGTNKILDKTWVASARKKLADASANLGGDFFEKSFIDTDNEMGYLTNEVETRKKLTKTVSKIAGASAGLTAAGLVSSSGVEGGVTEVTGDLGPDGQGQTDQNSGLGTGEGVPAEALIPDTKPVLPEAHLSDVKPSDVGVSSTAEGAITYNVPSGGEAQGGILESEVRGGEFRGGAGEEVSRSATWQPESSSMLEGGSPLGGPKSYNNSVPEIEPELKDGEYGHEDLEAGPEITHTVVKGDNAWNIMEGKGMDANPVGGKSEVVTEMSLQDRRYWLDKLFDYCDKHPDFAKEAGAVKSDGNIHIIYPGETLNVSMLDDKIRELMKLEASEVAIPTPRPDEMISSGDEGLTVEAADPDLSADNGPDLSRIGEIEEVASTNDVNELTMKEAYELYNANDNDPYVINRMAELGIDRKAFKDMMNSLQSRVPTDESEFWDGITIKEYLQNSLSKDEVLPAPQEDIQIQRIPEVTPYDGVAPRDGDVLVREASLNTEALGSNEVNVAAIKSYVSAIENPAVSFLDRLFFNSSPNISGTWEALNPNQTTVGQFKELVASPNLEVDLANRGISMEGINKWGETLQSQTNLIPANDNETLTQYLTRVVSGQRAA